MDPAIVQTIKTRLREIEIEHDITILLAIESGSRARGFESTDSDYDVRFIYKANKISSYLTILPQRDVIEYPIIDLFDYSGRDIKKALFLMHKSNPVLFEWLQSPIVYKKDVDSYATLTMAAQKYFAPITSIHHYLHMAKGNYRDYLQGDLVKIKKYFYVLRPLLACMWIQKNNQTPPLQFQELINNLSLDNGLLDTINTLLIRKKSGVEMGLEPKIPIINDFLEKQIVYFEEYAKTISGVEKTEIQYLDKIFLDLIG